MPDYNERYCRLQFVSIQINPDQMMNFGGTDDLCGIGYLSCMGKIGEEENKHHTTVLIEKLNRSLNIPADKLVPLLNYVIEFMV